MNWDLVAFIIGFCLLVALARFAFPDVWSDLMRLRDQARRRKAARRS